VTIIPYITERDREFFDKSLQEIVNDLATAGDLNYCITVLCNKFLNEIRYANLNEVIGCLECAKLEFYRRMVAPYEDIKSRQNGDVYNNV